MDDWFTALHSAGALAPDAARQLERDGYVVLPGPARGAQIPRMEAAYDAAVASAPAADVRVGRSSTRVDDFVSRGAEFDGLYVYPPLLEACCRVIGRPFQLSSLHARTLHAGAAAAPLHVDLPRDSDAWPLVGFILMIDAFRPDNGATRFVPGSHLRPDGPGAVPPERGTPTGAADPEIPACGPAGSLLVFHGSTWHAHSANVSGAPRRSVQGAFIPRDGRAAVDWQARVGPATLARLGALARYLLALPG